MIACVVIRDFAPTVERLADPTLANVPLLFVQYGKKKGKIVAVSPEARSAGIQPGVCLSRARALYPDGCFLTADHNRYQAALDKVLPVLWEFTNRVEVEDTIFPQTLVAYLDLGRLNDRDTDFMVAHLLQSIETETRFHASLGLASGKFPAYVAASAAKEDESIVVPRQGEAEFIAPYPVNLLPLSKDAARRLQMLCIRQIGQLAALPRSAMLGQFGKAGKLLYHLANGQDYGPVKPRQMPKSERVAREFDEPITHTARLDVIVHRLAGELETKLEARTSAMHAIALTVQMAKGKTHIENLYLLQPVASARAIAQTIQQLLGRAQIQEEIVGLEVCLTHLVPNIPRQLELFIHRPGRGQIIHLVQILAARHGDDCFYEVTLEERGSLLPERRFALKRVEVS